MANQLGKFTPNLAQMTQPLRKLLSKSRTWTWGPAQSAAFNQVKEELSKPTTLALYDPEALTKSFSGFILLLAGSSTTSESQKVNDQWKPVAYASRSMSETEQRYVQIEKEAIATTWACERFPNFLLVKHFSIETDHKPLVPLLGTKHLDCLPPRVLRFRLRLDRFNYTIRHVPGKELFTADALSRAPLPGQASADSTSLQELAELCMMSAVSHLPANSQRLETYATAQSKDPVCHQILNYCRVGWPNKREIDPLLQPYWEAQGELTVVNGLLMYGQRLVVPKALQTETLKALKCKTIGASVMYTVIYTYMYRIPYSGLFLWVQIFVKCWR